MLGAPAFAGANHRVENREQLSHARDEGELVRLAGRQQPRIERSNHGVALRRHECPIYSTPRILARPLYLATDRATQSDVVIKEARPLTNFWSARGEWIDAQALLRREYEMLCRLAGTCVVKAVEFFGEWEHFYLAETIAKGEPLYRLRARDSNSVAIHLHRDPVNVRRWLERFRLLARNLIAAVSEVHSRGIVLGDLSPNNIFVDPNDISVQLIDVESAVPLDEASVVAEFASVWSTPGFRSPQRAETRRIRPEDDWFAVGMVLFSFAIPVEALTAFEPSTRDRLFALQRSLGFPEETECVIRALLDGDRATAERLLNGLDPATVALPGLHAPVVVDDALTLAHTTARAIADYIIASGDATRSDRLWPANPTVFSSNSMCIASGACGNALFLHECTGEVPEYARSWLLSQPLGVDTHPPGLYTGLAGIAFTFDSIGEPKRALDVMRLAQQSPLRGVDPSVFQGDAGVGMADLAMYVRTGREELLDDATELADNLVRRAVVERDMLSWPQGDASPTPLGFAYGASGIALFLLHAGLLADRSDLIDAARQAMEFDIAHGVWIDDRLVWGDDARDISNRPYWLRGTSGIGSALVRFALLLDDPRYRKLAADAANGSYSLLCVVPTLFEGLSAIGELQLDMYIATGEQRYVDAAAKLVRTIQAYRIERPAGLAFPGRSLNRIATDFGWGSSGIGLFLKRLSSPGPRLLHDLLPVSRKATLGAPGVLAGTSG